MESRIQSQPRPSVVRLGVSAFWAVLLVIGAGSGFRPAHAEDFACDTSATGDWDDAIWSNCGGVTFPNNGAGLTYDAILNGATVDIDGGTGAVTIEDLFLNGSQLNLQGASLEVTGMATIDAGSGVVIGNSTVTGGTWTGAGSISTGITVNANLVSTVGNQFVLDAGSSMLVGNNSDLNVSGIILNNGTFGFNPASQSLASDSIEITTAATFDGTGRILLDGTDRRVDGSGVVTNSATHTIEGQGVLGGGGLTIINQGLVDANVNGGTLVVDAFGFGSGVAPGVTNSGTMRASNGATLSLVNDRIDGAGGTIEALDNSLVEFGNSTRVNGGTLNTDGSGVIRSATSSNVDLDGVTITSGSLIEIGNNSDINARGTVVNNGTITSTAFNQSSAVDSFEVNDNDGNVLTPDLFLNGNGRILMNRNEMRMDGSGLVVQGADHTIEGFGNVGGGALEVTNNGLITANISGETLIVDTFGFGTSATAGFVNNGTARAENGGVLRLLNDRIDNTNGVIEVVNGSRIELGNSTLIENGVLDVSGTGVLLTDVSSNVALSNVDLQNTAQVLIGNNSDLNIEGVVTNNGTIGYDSANQSSAADSLEITSTLLLQGTGNVLMTGNGASIDGSGVFTQAAGHTIEGEGRVGAGALTIINNGLIDANVNGATMVIDTFGFGSQPAPGLTNTGTIQASNGGIVSLVNDRIDNSDGTIQALDGSRVDLGSTTRIDNGTLASSGSGLLRTATSSNVDLDGVTIAAGSLVEIGNNSDLNIRGNITNNGVIQTTDINQSSAADSLEILNADGDASTVDTVLGGTGTVILNRSESRVDGSGYLSHAAGHTIEGQGAIGIGGLKVDNAGTVNGNVSGTTLTIDTFGFGTSAAEAGFTNTGTVLAENGGTVDFANDRVDNTSTGIFEAGDGSAIVMSTTSARLDNNVAGDLTGGSYRSLSDGAGARIQINGDPITTNSAEIVLSGSGSTFETRIGNTTNFNQLEETLTSNSADGALRILNNRDYSSVNNLSNAGELELGGGTFDNLPGSVISNSGEIHGFGTLADFVSNTGTVRAHDGRLVIAGVVGNTQGNVIIDDTGAMTVGGLGGPPNALNLTHNGTDLDIGGNNFTVRNDYQNDSFGTGNAFDGRANVTGTGEIRALNATQEITGADVSNGASPNVTISFGNVREGDAAATEIQIANNGTATTLRGAVQNTNAGDLSVSDQNFTVGPGGSTGNISIGVNAGVVGGAITGTIDVVNNFDNVANQQITVANSAVYELAEGAVGTNTVDFGNYRVNSGSTSQNVSAENLTTNASFGEGLQLALTDSTTGGDISLTNNAGDGSLIAAGSAARADAIVITNDRTQAGAVSGTVDVGFLSDGTGTSGFTNDLSVGNAQIAVLGQGFVSALGAIDTAALNFGTVQVGQTVTQNLVVSNVATGPAGFVEDLNAAFGSSTDGRITGSGGGINGVLAGQDSSTSGTGSLVVGVDTSSAGSVNGSIQVDFFSSGNVGGVDQGLGGAIAANSAAYSVTGTIDANVIDAANPVINNQTIDFGAARVGDAASTVAVSIINADTSPADQAALNADSIVSNGVPVTTNGGTFAGLEVGDPANTDLSVTFNTNVAGDFTGANAGSATIDFVSDASNIGGCEPNCLMDIADGTVTLTGKVYTAAEGQANTSSVDFGNVRVGDAVADGVIQVENAAAVTALNDTLRVDVAGVSGPFGAPTSVADIAAGTTSDLGVSFDTGSAGAFSQDATLSFTSQNPDLADISAGDSANVQITGQVFQAAVGAIDTVDLDFGVVQVGQTVSQNLVVSNVATGPAGFVENLNAEFGASSGLGAGLISGSGSVANVLAGTSSATTGTGALLVTVNTDNAANVNGDIAVNFFTSGVVGTTSNGLGVAAANSELFGVVGTIGAVVVDQANPVIDTPVVNLVARVGDAAPTSAVSVTNQATGNAQAALTATGITSNDLPTIGAAGSFALLDPGATSTDLSVSLDTSVSADVNGSATIDFVSDASNQGCTSNCQMNLASQDVQVNGQVYAYAEAEVSASTVDFGVVRVGETANAAVTVSNVGSGVLVDDLVETGRSANVSGGLIMLGSGEMTDIMVSLDTSAAGVFQGLDAAVASIDFASRNPVLADAALPTQNILLTGQVNNLAEVDFSEVSGDGSLAQAGATFTYDFGNVLLGSTVSGELGLLNSVTGPSDFLTGAFNPTGLTDFALSGFDQAIDLLAGEILQGLLVSFDANMLGSFSESIIFDGISAFAGLADITLGSYEIRFLANVVEQTQVPEPSALLLIALGLIGLVYMRRRPIGRNV